MSAPLGFELLELVLLRFCGRADACALLRFLFAMLDGPAIEMLEPVLLLVWERVLREDIVVT